MRMQREVIEPSKGVNKGREPFSRHTKVEMIIPSNDNKYNRLINGIPKSVGYVKEDNDKDYSCKIIEDLAILKEIRNSDDLRKKGNWFRILISMPVENKLSSDSNTKWELLGIYDILPDNILTVDHCEKITREYILELIPESMIDSYGNNDIMRAYDYSNEYGYYYKEKEEDRIYLYKKMSEYREKQD